MPTERSKFSKYFVCDDYSLKDLRWWLGQKKKMLLTYSLRKQVNEDKYEKILRTFLDMNEGCVLYPYLDTRGHWHIGHGFLLKKAENFCYEKLIVDAFYSIDIDIEKILPIHSLQNDSFQNSLQSKRNIITQLESEKILLYILKCKTKEIKEKIPYFDNLNWNLKIAIHSLYYNSQNLIGPKFLEGLNQYYLKDELIGLIKCIEQVLKHSNPGKNKNAYDWKGIQNRRDREAVMLGNAYTDCLMQYPLYENNQTTLNKKFRSYLKNNNQEKMHLLLLNKEIEENEFVEIPQIL